MRVDVIRTYEPHDVYQITMHPEAALRLVDMIAADTARRDGNSDYVVIVDGRLYAWINDGEIDKTKHDGDDSDKVH